MSKKPLKPLLYVVATPIGHLSDITLRALDVLKECDEIICEDTRVSKVLLNHYGISKPLLTYHEHNASKMRPLLLQKMNREKVLALISDAGMPLISDPGYKLLRLCEEAHIPFTVIPGASSVLSALILSGMPTDRFVFCGFADRKKVQQYQEWDLTLIFFESAKRLLKTLESMKTIFQDRSIAIVREITKIFEEVKKGNFDEVISYFKQYPPKGEIVLVLSPPLKKQSNHDYGQELLLLLKSYSLKESVLFLSKKYNVSKNDIYKQALKIKEKDQCIKS